MVLIKINIKENLWPHVSYERRMGENILTDLLGTTDAIIVACLIYQEVKIFNISDFQKKSSIKSIIL